MIVADKRRADRRRSPPLHDAPSEDVELHLTPVAAGSKDDGVDIYAALPTSEGSALAGASAGVSGHAFAAVSLRARSRRAATSSAARLRAPPPDPFPEWRPGGNHRESRDVGRNRREFSYLGFRLKNHATVDDRGRYAAPFIGSLGDKESGQCVTEPFMRLV